MHSGLDGQIHASFHIAGSWHEDHSTRLSSIVHCLAALVPNGGWVALDAPLVHVVLESVFWPLVFPVYDAVG